MRKHGQLRAAASIPSLLTPHPRPRPPRRCCPGSLLANELRSAPSILREPGELTWSAAAAALLTRVPGAAYHRLKGRVEKEAVLARDREVLPSHVFAAAPEPRALFASPVQFSYAAHSGPVYQTVACRQLEPEGPFHTWQLEPEGPFHIWIHRQLEPEGLTHRRTGLTPAGRVGARACAQAFSPFHRNVFLSASTDSSVRLYNQLQPTPFHVIEPSGASIFAAAWSPARCLLHLTSYILHLTSYILHLRSGVVARTVPSHVFHAYHSYHSHTPTLLPLLPP